MSPLVDTARSLIAQTGEGPVVSLLFSLDPSEFATAPARNTEIDSLLDEASRLASAREDGLDHAATMALRGDLDAIGEYLRGDELPVSDARALAVYASGGRLLATVALATDAGPSVTIGEHPLIEPLVVAPARPAWAAVLPSLDRADIYLGTGERVRAHQHEADYVRGHSAQGGPTGHDEEQDAENHLIAVVRRLELDRREGRFSRLLLGGPVQAVSAFEKLLSDPLRAALLPERLGVDPSSASESEIGEAAWSLVHDAESRAQAELLSELESRLGEARGSDRPARAVLGPEAVTEALVERRVETLLLSPAYAGSEREDAIREAVAQDADVVAFSDEVSELGASRPIAALLRF